MTSALERKQDGSIVLTITIPQEKIQKTKEKVLDAATKTAVVPGFRKGKAPTKLVAESLSAEKIKEETLKQLLPESYIAAVTQHKLNPIMHPKIHAQSMDDEKDWQIIALTCEAPVIDLGDYKKNIGKVTAKSKIVIPGREDPFGSAQGKQKEPDFDEIIKVLLQSVNVNLPDILVEQEVEKALAQTIDEIKRLGLSLDQYLSASRKTPESLRQEYTEKAKNDLTIELALQKIAETEHIVVEPKEIDEAITKAKDEKERKHLQQNSYLLASILSQQKTLDFLKHL